MQEKRVTAKATTDHQEILYVGGQQGVVLKEFSDEEWSKTFLMWVCAIGTMRTRLSKDETV